MRLQETVEHALQTLRIAGHDEIFGKGKLRQGETHLVFGFSPHAHFSMHQDAEKYMWTLVVQLSPGSSTIEIAGKEDIHFTLPGHACVFPSQAWHRSGYKERRTLMMSVFFMISEKVKKEPSEPKPEAEEDKEEKSDQKPQDGGSSSKTE